MKVNGNVGFTPKIGEAKPAEQKPQAQKSQTNKAQDLFETFGQYKFGFTAKPEFGNKSQTSFAQQSGPVSILEAPKAQTGPSDIGGMAPKQSDFGLLAGVSGNRGSEIGLQMGPPVDCPFTGFC